MSEYVDAVDPNRLGILKSANSVTTTASVMATANAAVRPAPRWTRRPVKVPVKQEKERRSITHLDSISIDIYIPTNFVKEFTHAATGENDLFNKPDIAVTGLVVHAPQVHPPECIIAFYEGQLGK